MIADDPDYLNVLYVNTFDELMNIRDTLVNRICTFGKYSTFSIIHFHCRYLLDFSNFSVSNLCFLIKNFSSVNYLSLRFHHNL